MAEITIRISDNTLKTAAIVLGVLSLVSLSIYLWSSGLFAAKYRLRAYVPEVEGLGVHAPVKLNGIDIGTVAKILPAAKPPDPEHKIELVLQIEKRYQRDILSDSSASLNTIGILGSRYVNIDRGIRGNPIPEGGEVPVLPTTAFTLKDFTLSLAKLVDCVDQKKQDTESKLRSH